MCREEMKLVYVRCLGSDRSKYWVSVSPPNRDFNEFHMRQEPFLNLEYSLDDDHKNLVFTSTAVWKSKIYFIGVQFQFYDVTSNKVYAIDTTTTSYDKNLSPMNSPRKPLASVAVSPGNIYVFGGNLDNNLDKFAELYDIEKNVWSYLPRPPDQIRWMRSYAVYESTDGKTRCIYFRCNSGRGLVSLDLNSLLWKVVNPISNISNTPFWNAGAVAVVDDVLIWLHRAAIYAHDFKKDETFLLLDLHNDYPFNTFLHPDYPCRCADHPNLHVHNPGCLFPDETPSYLFHLGDSRLCLIWGDLYTLDLLHCSTFLIKKGGEEERISLELERQQQISTPCMALLDVALV